MARALAPNTELDIYRIEGTLGSGGFGITYAAWDSVLERRVAIKEYFPLAVAARDSATGAVWARDTATYDYGLTSFLHEARVLARFSHRNIVRVLRYLRANNTAYMVMEYEEGETLTDAIQRGTMPPGPLLRMTIRLLQGLAAVHGAGVLHRDIKPDNVYLRDDGSPVLLDFGAAREAIAHSHENVTVVLTPGYAPLEQYSEDLDEAGPWTDVYALGATLLHALSGVTPTEAMERLTSIHYHNSDPLAEVLAAARTRANGIVVDTLRWMLHHEPAHRPQTCVDVLKMLNAPHDDSQERIIALESDDVESVESTPPSPRVRPVAASPNVVSSARGAPQQPTSSEYQPTAAETAAAHEALTELFGPVGRVIVKRAAAAADDQYSFVAAIAAELTDIKLRDAWLQRFRQT